MEKLVREVKERYLRKVVECKSVEEFVRVFEEVWEWSDEEKEMLSDGDLMGGFDCLLYEDIVGEREREKLEKELEIIKEMARLELEYLNEGDWSEEVYMKYKKKFDELADEFNRIG